jgi:hypothetical protein
MQVLIRAIQSMRANGHDTYTMMQTNMTGLNALTLAHVRLNKFMGATGYFNYSDKTSNDRWFPSNTFTLYNVNSLSFVKVHINFLCHFYSNYHATAPAYN